MNNNLQQVNILGVSKSKFDFADQFDAAENAIGDFIERVQGNIETEGLNVTGAISDIQMQRDGDGIVVTAPVWLVFQDKGVNGSVQKLYETPFEYKDKRPPLEPFIQWVEARNIQTRNNEPHSGEAQSFAGEDAKSIAWAIREKVFKEGIEPKNIYTKEIPQLVDDLVENIAGFKAESLIENLFN